MGVALVSSCSPWPACESTQDKSARLEAAGSNKLKGEKGLAIGQKAVGVHVGTTAVLADANGGAVVARAAQHLRQATARRADRRQGHRRGRQGGLQERHAGPRRVADRRLRAPAQGDAVWVNDQVDLSGAGKHVAVTVGAPRHSSRGDEPKLSVSAPAVRRDPVSGLEAAASVTNDSKIAQRELVVLGVARRGGRIVAAGRAIVPLVKPGKKAKFNLFFIGNPKGARVTLSAPPTTF